MGLCDTRQMGDSRNQGDAVAGRQREELAVPANQRFIQRTTYIRADAEPFAEPRGYLADGGVCRLREPWAGADDAQHGPSSFERIHSPCHLGDRQTKHLWAIGEIRLGVSAPEADVIAGRNLSLLLGIARAAEVGYQGQVVDIAQVLGGETELAAKPH